MDIFTKEKRSRIMASIRSKRTKPEMTVHGLLKGGKIKHRMWPDLPGHPDVEIAPGSWSGGRRIVVFVNGCFWHGCPEHFRVPKTNRAFWAKKIGRNIVRQNDVVFELTQTQGVAVALVWEHELRGKVTVDDLELAILKGVVKAARTRKSTKG